jgi:hypothetical protein
VPHLKSATPIFGFPETVNEFSARQVAAGVVALTTLFALSGSTLLLAAITVGFIARVVSGPTLSPLGQFVTRVVTPTLEACTGRTGPQVAGTPKRFAQAIGAMLSLTALGTQMAGFGNAAIVIVLMITAAASLESMFGYCLGCTIFAKLIDLRVLPESVCEDCNDINRRLASSV